ncbi:MAG: tetratricopeptide repeat protein [Deltaproteobacteria bacterium]|nr:tetratricopeptide repeat protein [Deltaproteobacteria bacterium]
MESFRKAVALAALAAFTFIIYSNVLHGPFIFDDGMYIIDNTQIRDSSLLWPPSPRYLTYLSFAFNYSHGGLNTFGYHLFNVIVHIFNSALVFAIALLLFRTAALKDKGVERYALPVALMASFFFAAHPVQTQAVSYITQRFASLTALFYLLSVACYLKWRTSEGSSRLFFYAVALLSAVAAQFTKETGFTLPAVILLLEYAFFRGTGSALKRLFPLVPFILVMAIVPVLLFAPGVFGAGSAGISETTRVQQLRDLDTVSRHDYLATQFRVMATYFRLLVAPYGQNLDYHYTIFKSFLAPQVVLSALFLVIPIFGLGLFLLGRGIKGRGPLSLIAGTGILFFFIAISIESSIIPINDVIYEHRLYLPSAGAALFFAAALMGLFEFSKKRFKLAISPLAWAVVAVIVLAAPLGAATFARNSLWADDILFWRDVVAKSPDKGRVHNNYGRVLYKKGMTAEGMAEFKLAVKLDPVTPSGYYNLGNAYKDLGLMDEAIKAFETAIEQDPGKLNARNNLGLVYLMVGRPAEAVEQFETMLLKNPNDFKAHNNLGLAYSAMGRADLAEEEFRAAVFIKPDFADALNNLRIIELKRGME